MRESLPELSERDLILLFQVYGFQRERRFRYGLRLEYIRYVENVEEVVESLRQKGLAFTIAPYTSGATYVLLTKAGRRVVEEVLEIAPEAERLASPSSAKQAWFLARTVLEKLQAREMCGKERHMVSQ